MGHNGIASGGPLIPYFLGGGWLCALVSIIVAVGGRRCDCRFHASSFCEFFLISIELKFVIFVFEFCFDTSISSEGDEAKLFMQEFVQEIIML